jgi:carbon monoxide dehydrogenase subunit G
MKYTSEIVINLPRTQVVEKLDNPENMKHWQKGLVSYEQLSDDPKAPGATMKLAYKIIFLKKARMQRAG